MSSGAFGGMTRSCESRISSNMILESDFFGFMRTDWTC